MFTIYNYIIITYTQIKCVTFFMLGYIHANFYKYLLIILARKKMTNLTK